MSRKHSFARGPSAFRRGSPRVPLSGKSFLIVTEGKKTEPNYFNALRHRLGLSLADVVIEHPPGTDPVNLLRKAVELRDFRAEEAKNGNVVPYDEVWIVFDLEKTHDPRRKLAKQAMAMKEGEGIKFADSDPAFEYWLLLHCENTTSGFADCAKVVNRLKKHWPEYTKGQSPAPEFLEKLPNAVRNAERCRQHHKSSQGDGNPSTRVDLLARSLNSATRKHLQFGLP